MSARITPNVFLLNLPDLRGSQRGGLEEEAQGHVERQWREKRKVQWMANGQLKGAGPGVADASPPYKDEALSQTESINLWFGP